MSKYSKLIGEILDSIYEGYTLDEKTKKLKVVNEARANKAAESVHTLVLEKARELWDMLEASEESLAGVAEEISFEELNTDPSSMDLDVSGGKSASPKASKSGEEDLSSMLGEAGDFDLDSIFDSMDHLDDKDGDMPYNEELGDEEEESDLVDGDEEFSDEKMDSDNGYDNGDEELDGDLGGDEFGDDLDGDLGGDEFGDDLDGDLGGDEFGDEELEGDDNGFDFDLDLDSSEEPEGEDGEDLDLGDEDPEGEDLDLGDEDPEGEDGEEGEELDLDDDDFEEGKY